MSTISTTSERKEQLIQKMARVDVLDCKLVEQGTCPTCRGKGEVKPRPVPGEAPPRRQRATVCQTCVGEKKVFIYSVRYFSKSLGSQCEDRLASPVKLTIKDFKPK